MLFLLAEILKTIMNAFIYFKTSEKASAYIKQQNFQYAYFLIKGSRSMQMEKVLNAFKVE